MSGRYPVRRGQTLQLVNVVSQDVPADPAACGACNGPCAGCKAAAQVPVDLTGWTITAEVRNARGPGLVGAFAVTVHADQVDHKGEFELWADTTAWPVGVLVTDIRFEYAAGDKQAVDYTDVIELLVTETVTGARP